MLSKPLISLHIQGFGSPILDTSNFNSGTQNLGLSDLHHTGVAAASGIFRNLSLCSFFKNCKISTFTVCLVIKHSMVTYTKDIP